MSAVFVLVRVISWIDFHPTIQAIHEITRTDTKKANADL
jgi:hypothetical protein